MHFCFTTGFVESGDKKKCLLKLYSADGILLNAIKVPGNHISDCSWQKSGSKLAIAADSYIFFANVKAQYNWACLNQGIVYTSTEHGHEPSNNGNDKKLTFFWNIQNNVCCQKVIENVHLLVGCSAFCAIVTKSTRHPTKSVIKLFNSMGICVENHVVNMNVKNVCMNTNRVVVADEQSFYIWSYAHLNEQFVASRKLFANGCLSIVQLLSNQMQTQKTF